MARIPDKPSYSCTGFPKWLMIIFFLEKNIHYTIIHGIQICVKKKLKKIKITRDEVPARPSVMLNFIFQI